MVQEFLASYSKENFGDCWSSNTESITSRNIPKIDFYCIKANLSPNKCHKNSSVTLKKLKQTEYIKKQINLIAFLLIGNSTSLESC